MCATTASGPSRSPTTTSGWPPPSPGSGSPPGPRSIWRYADLLPVSDPAPVDLGAGFTPLVRADRLAAELGLGELWIKDDTANPTGSFKDRVVSVALTKARQLGFKIAACASTGNLANSVAAHAARAGMDSVVLIPHDLERAKVTMTSVYGGTGHRRRGQLRRRQPALRRADQRAAVVGLRQRQRADLLRRRFEDPGLRGGRAVGMAGAGPRGGADRIGEPADQGGQGVRRAVEGRPARRGAVGAGFGSPGRGLLAGGHRLCRGVDAIRPVKPDTIAKSLAIGNPADGWYALDAIRTSGRLLRLGDRRRGDRRRSSCWPGPRASSPRRPAV